MVNEVSVITWQVSDDDNESLTYWLIAVYWIKRKNVENGTYGADTRIGDFYAILSEAFVKIIHIIIHDSTWKDFRFRTKVLEKIINFASDRVNHQPSEQISSVLVSGFRPRNP